MKMLISVTQNKWLVHFDLSWLVWIRPVTVKNSQSAELQAGQCQSQLLTFHSYINHVLREETRVRGHHPHALPG
jgi:hypothetical protein